MRVTYRSRRWWGPVAVAATVALATSLPALAHAATAVTPLQKLSVTNAEAGDWLGTDIAVSGDIAVVGVRDDDSLGLVDVGSARVFLRSGGQWVESVELHRISEGAYDGLGASVDVDGDIVVCGAPEADTARGTDAGAVQAFVRSGFWNDAGGKRYHDAYFARYPNVWCHGDYCELTARGTMIVYGRSDATLNPGGVRIGTAEIYGQVEKIDDVEEAVAIGQLWPPEQPSDTRVVLFVKLRPGLALDAALEERIRRQIREHTSPRHVPARIVQVPDIPRTKNGKVVELAVKAMVHGMPVTHTDALANPEVLGLFRNMPELAV